ncbi:protein TRANSPORT INHIBITOR RESPONSE 1-like [Pyrus ussuriensis x Pyrus communis]|uniref:Protein TRANSPORT INHIBITOR RESPONSE 1-like n=1 Tax=Pyrus ussuriensis x Pyrus communis TaxID=2448454 RepID=A0A5N5FIS1_9ROSA|nr:protein TRANSPORT INHIBITOR RESPONSE 1-like [Pyrus ussuriensis x Pyrus communis]
MTVTDESLEMLGVCFGGFKALSLVSCDGFSIDGLAAIATHSKNLIEHQIDEKSGSWLGYFPETFTSLEILNFASLNSDVDFDALERLVKRCISLRVLKVNKYVTLEQLQRLLTNSPRLLEIAACQNSQLLRVFSNCANLNTLSGLWEATTLYLPVVYPACTTNLTFLNLSYAAALQSWDLAELVAYRPRLRRLWVLDTVEDQGLKAVGSNCPLLEELRVFPSDPDGDGIIRGVTESGFAAVSHGSRKLRYILYFCWQMTNAAVVTVAQNCPDITHFRLCIMIPGQPDYITNEPMDEAFGAVVKNCTKLQRLSVSGLLTDHAFECIGMYAKNLEKLSVAFAGKSDLGMQCVLKGCPKLKKLEIRDCPFGNETFLSDIEKYESMRSLWMSACNVTINACRLLASQMPRLNVEVMKDEGDDDRVADKVYVYRSVAGPRRDAPPFVLTF